MALSVSFNFRWEPTAPRAMSDDWVTRAIRQSEDAEVDKKLAGERSRTLASKAGPTFYTLMERAKTSVATLRAAGDFGELSFASVNAAEFTVTNLTYPCVDIVVSMGNGCFLFATTITATDKATPQTKRDRIDLSLDDTWENVVMRHDGMILPSMDAVCEKLLAPAVHRRGFLG